MQTVKVSLALDLKAVVPQGFLDEARKEAQAPDTTPFLKDLQARFPDPKQDDQFILALLKNSLRIHLRGAIADHLQRAGIGGTVSPVRFYELDEAEAVVVGREKTLALAEVPNIEAPVEARAE